MTQGILWYTAGGVLRICAIKNAHVKVILVWVTCQEMVRMLPWNKSGKRANGKMMTMCFVASLSMKDFKHALKHNKKELTLVELSSHMRIEESFKVQDSDKPNGNTVAGPSVVNMVEHDNFLRKLSQRSLVNGTNDIGGSTVPEEVTKEVLADLPLGCKPFGCKSNFKRKLKVDESIEKFKARLVIQGFRQKSGIDYFDTYALVARISTIRLLIVLASIHTMIIHQMNAKTAFLNSVDPNF
nr:zinc finger, CCHC-type [Tanacetum cinerariifolium]